MSSSLGDVWKAAASNPDPNADLGYDLQPLIVIELDEPEGGSYMILPGEAEHLESEEFMVADPGSVCRLDECR